MYSNPKSKREMRLFKMTGKMNVRDTEEVEHVADRFPLLVSHFFPFEGASNGLPRIKEKNNNVELI